MLDMNASTISINGVTHTIDNEENLHNILQLVNEDAFFEVWVTFGNGKSMSALINKSLSWLMYLRFDGDPGYSSRNSENKIDDDKLIEFYLSNGQKDFYPLSYTITTESAKRALEYFFVSSDMAPWIKWHDDSVLD